MCGPVTRSTLDSDSLLFGVLGFWVLGSCSCSYSFKLLRLKQRIGATSSLHNKQRVQNNSAAIFTQLLHECSEDVHYNAIQCFTHVLHMHTFHLSGHNNVYQYIYCCFLRILIIWIKNWFYCGEAENSTYIIQFFKFN